MPNDRLLQLPFPAKGLDVTEALSRQPPLTCPAAANARLYESLTQRARGGSRSGLSRYVAGQVNSGLTPIQGLDTVVSLDAEHQGAANFQDGDPAWVQIGHAGTYVLAYSNGNNPWKMSATMGVDVLGNVAVGRPAQGVPIGGDGFDSPALVLASPISLPAGYFVLAYWQPGAFPWGQAGETVASQGDWQDGHLFPGFGWMADNFPAGAVDAAFGFPAATTPGFTVPDTPTQHGVPATPFWNWPSGYGTIEIDITLQRAFVISASVVEPDPSRTMATTLALNGRVLVDRAVTNANPLIGMFTNDARVRIPAIGQEGLNVLRAVPSGWFNRKGSRGNVVNVRLAQSGPPGADFEFSVSAWKNRRFLSPAWTNQLLANVNGTQNVNAGNAVNYDLSFTL